MLPNLSVEETDWQITPWSAPKHAHHGPDFGLDLTQYGLTQADLDSIAKNGIKNHIRQGGTVTNAEYVKALQNRWKMFGTVGFKMFLGNRVMLSKITLQESFSHLMQRPEKAVPVIY